MKTFATLLAGAVLAASATFASAEETLRLEWVIQGQFAGPLVAAEKGYYKEAGVDLKLLPAGPDIKPAVTVAQGVDSFGIGHPQQVIAARSNGAPLVTISQFGQRSASVYIARKADGINSIHDLKGKSVGLWFGGDEFEFMAMLDANGIPRDDVRLISQGYDIVAWMSKQYDVMQVALYNELLQVYRQGVKPEELTILDPADSGVAMVNTGMFTTEKMIAEKPEVVQAVVNATLRGWADALANPEAAAEIVVKHNSELVLQEQIEQIKAMGTLFCAGPTLEGKFGYSDGTNWEVAQTILIDGRLIEAPIDLSKGFTNAFWEKSPAEYHKINCAK